MDTGFTQPQADASSTSQSPGKILSVSPLAADHAYLRRVGEKNCWETHEAYGCREAMVAIAEQHPDVILCEAKLPDGGWMTLLENLSHRLNPPRLIVTSRLADDYLWAEALNLGAYDVLHKPFDEEEVRRVVGFACECDRISVNRTAA